MKNILSLILLSLFIILTGYCVYQDCKTRKIPNKLFLIGIIIGLLYGLVSHHLLESILGFILITVMGVYARKFHLMYSGDMKFLSILFFILNLRNIRECIFMIFYCLVMSFIFGIYFYNKQKKHILEELKKEMVAYKAIFYKLNLFKLPTYETKEEMLAKTMPFTLPIYLAFLATLLTECVLYFV